MRPLRKSCRKTSARKLHPTPIRIHPDVCAYVSQCVVLRRSGPLQILAIVYVLYIIHMYNVCNLNFTQCMNSVVVVFCYVWWGQQMCIHKPSAMPIRSPLTDVLLDECQKTRRPTKIEVQFIYEPPSEAARTLNTIYDVWFCCLVSDSYLLTYSYLW